MRRRYFAATISMLAMAVPIAAHATAIYPYAFASDQITNLRVENSDTGQLVSIPLNSGSQEAISDSAQYDGYGISGYQSSGAINSALSISQAFSGPSSSTPPASFTAVGPGNMIGARADAAIGALVAPGPGVVGGSSVSNVAEAYGDALGSSSAANVAYINFTFSGTGYPLDIIFQETTELVATTAGASSGFIGESASASALNALVLSGSNGSSFSAFPFGSNGQVAVSSSNGTGSSPYSSSGIYSIVTPTLDNGVTYTLSLQSSVTETIQAGSAVPEPPSGLLVGFGVLGLWALVRRANKSRHRAEI